METVYAASKNCPFLIHAQEPPHTSQNGKQYIVDLEPVGRPAISKYTDCKPSHVHALKDSLRYILSALLHLHQAGFAHTDLRWENIILQPAGTWVLIDLEFAYTIPFTPDGYVRKRRPELCKQPWAARCDIMLVGDLMGACSVCEADLGDQGIELKRSMQAGEWDSAASVLQHVWFT